MLRLAHRIGSSLQVKCADRSHFQYFSNAANMIRKDIQTAEIVIADNVATYVQGIGKEAYGLVLNATPGGLYLALEDIPNLMPPFENLFIEWVPVGEHDSADVSQAGFLFKSMPAEKAVDDGLSTRQHFEQQREPHTFVVAFHLYADRSGRAVYDGNFQSYFLDKLGQMSSENMRRVEGADFFYPPLCAPLMAISFMHCKNVARIDATETEGPSPKWIRRQKQPTLRYHVLQIDPMKEVLRKEGGSETNGLKKALHICRGHFATFSEEKPLFGKLAGTFWRPSHVRGSAKEGVVVKDYQVNPGVG